MSTPRNPADDFEVVAPKDNFYQTSAFIPMSFALVTTMYESGESGAGPHALCYPFGITHPHSMMLISRGSSGTAANIRRTGQCALNYVEFDRERLQGIATLGYPGQALVKKQSANPYPLTASPPGLAGFRPQIVADACQVFECTWDRSIRIDEQLGDEGPNSAAHFVLRIDRILMRRNFVAGISDGSIMPHLPIFLGFRTGGNFWFNEPGKPFPVPIPKVEGRELQSLVYLANRIDTTIRFTDAACGRLTGVPAPFIKDVLEAIVAIARQEGIQLIDVPELDRINARRQQ